MTVTEKLNGYGPLAGIKVVEMCTYVAAPATVPRPVRDGRRGHQDRVLRRRYPAHPGPRLRLRADRYGRSHHRFEQHQQELGVAQPEGSRGPGHREEDDRRGRHLHEQHAHRRPEEARARLRNPARRVPGLIWGQMRGYGEFGEFAMPPATTPCAGPPVAVLPAPSPRRTPPPPFPRRPSATTTPPS